MRTSISRINEPLVGIKRDTPERGHGVDDEQGPRGAAGPADSGAEALVHPRRRLALDEENDGGFFFRDGVDDFGRGNASTGGSVGRELRHPGTKARRHVRDALAPDAAGADEDRVSRFEEICDDGLHSFFVVVFVVKK